MVDKGTVNYFDREVSEQDVMDFIDSFPDRERRCPTCRSNAWKALVITPESDEFLSVRTTKVGGFPGDNYVPIFFVTCTCCGYVQQYMAYQLVQWLKSREEEAR